MTGSRCDRRDHRAAVGRQHWPKLLCTVASALCLTPVSLPLAAPAQGVDNHWIIQQVAAERGVPSSAAAGQCPAWLDDPIVRQALQQAETTLRQEQNNQFALSKLMDAPALLNRDLLADKAKSTVSDTVLRIYNQRSNSPQRIQEASEFANGIRRMSPDEVSRCLPQIAGILAETDSRIVGADKVEVEQRAAERTPSGRLVIVYRGYAAMRDCLRSRAGRQFTYVTQNDVDEARGQAKAIEQYLVRDNPALDLDGLWAKAVKPEALPTDLLGMFANLDLVGRHDVEAGDLTENGKAYCQHAKRSLEQNFQEVFPEGGARKKDF